MTIINGTAGSTVTITAPSTQLNVPTTVFANTGNKEIDFRSSTADNDLIAGVSSSNAPYYTVSAVSDTILSGSGNDLLVGGSLGPGLLGSLLVAGAGSDTLIGSTGKDSLIGGTGADEIQAGNGSSTIVAGSGTDLIYVAQNGSSNIHNVNGSDSIYVDQNATATIYLSNSWTPGSNGEGSAGNLGTATVYLDSNPLLDLSTVTTQGGWKIVNNYDSGKGADTGYQYNPNNPNGSLSNLASTPATINGGSYGHDTIVSGTGGDNISLQGGYNYIYDNGTVGNNITDTGAGGHNTIVGFNTNDYVDGGSGAGNTLIVNPTDLSALLPVDITNPASADGILLNIQNIVTTNAATTINLTNQTASFNITTGTSSNTLDLGTGASNGTLASDTVTGGGGANLYIINQGGTQTITNFQDSKGTEVLQVKAGGVVDATLVGNWTAGSTSYNNGSANFTANGYSVDLRKIGAGNGINFADTGSVASATYYASHNADSITGGNGNNDSIYGGGGNDVLTTGTGHGDYFVGASTGHDTYQIAAGDSNLSTATNGSTPAVSGDYTDINNLRDYITGYKVGADTISYSTANLSIGGESSYTVSPGVTVAINQTTGQATFTGIAPNLYTEVQDLNASFAAAGQHAGNFAFFQNGNNGDEYLLISDGQGLNNEVLIKLIGVEGVHSINLSGHSVQIAS